PVQERLLAPLRQRGSVQRAPLGDFQRLNDVIAETAADRLWRQLAGLEREDRRLDFRLKQIARAHPLEVAAIVTARRIQRVLLREVFKARRAGLNLRQQVARQGLVFDQDMPRVNLLLDGGHIGRYHLADFAPEQHLARRLAVFFHRVKLIRQHLLERQVVRGGEFFLNRQLVVDLGVRYHDFALRGSLRDQHLVDQTL